MMKKTHKILIGVLILLASFVSVIIYVFYLMDIEDRYGNLQNVYFKSNSGDILINNLNSKTGEIFIKSNRVYIIENKNEKELEEWLDPNSKMKYNLDVYDSNSKNKKSKLHLEFEY